MLTIGARIDARHADPRIDLVRAFLVSTAVGPTWRAQSVTHVTGSRVEAPRAAPSQW